MPRLLFVLLALPLLGLGQDKQIGGFVGRGGLLRIFETSAYHVVAGVEGCVLCGGRFGLFMEYQHWSKIGEGTDQPVSLHLASGGLRIQGKGARVRPFLDLGFLAGTEKEDQPVYPFALASRGVAGGVLGFGAAVSIAEHWYIRPMAKIIGLSSTEMGGFAGAAVGYRF